MPRLYSNNFSTTLASGISAVDTSFDVASAAGLPTLAAGDYFHLTIDDGSFIEIVRVDAVVGNTLSVQRGQESTVQRVFASGSTVELRVTAGSFGAQSVPVAADITYDNTVSGLTAIELQAAVDELAAAGGGDAADIAYDNTLSGLIATQVQAAIDEIVSRQLGWGQTWQNLTSSRNLGVTYTNSSGKPISVMFSTAGNGLYTVNLGAVSDSYTALNSDISIYFIVPDGDSYSISGAGNGGWLELR